MRRDKIYKNVYSEWDGWEFIKGIIDDVIYREFYLKICDGMSSFANRSVYNKCKKYSLEKIIKLCLSKQIDLEKYCNENLLEQLRESENDNDEQRREISDLKRQIKQLEDYKKNNQDYSNLIKMYKPIVHNAKMMAVNELETIKMCILEGEKDIIKLIDKEIEILRGEQNGTEEV